jgi:FkbM family methyltransferase
VAVVQLAGRARALAARALVRARGPKLVTLRVPGTEHSVFARAEGSDLAAFHHVFGDAYDFELPEAPFIFDLGANVGYASVYFALRHPGARVLAVEPVPGNAALLRRNVERLPGIEVVEGAVWPRPSRLVLEDPGKGYWGMRVTERAGGGVAAVTIGELLDRADADWIDLVKVDIEGSERELFSENTDWLEYVGALVLELHDRFVPGCREALDQAIARSGVRFREVQKGEDVVLIREGVSRSARRRSGGG